MGWNRKNDVGGARQEFPDLLKCLELCFVHIDHHGWMIDPKSSFQPHMPLETRTRFQPYMPLEDAGTVFSNPGMSLKGVTLRSWGLG